MACGLTSLDFCLLYGQHFRHKMPLEQLLENRSSAEDSSSLIFQWLPDHISLKITDLTLVKCAVPAQVCQQAQLVVQEGLPSQDCLSYWQGWNICPSGAQGTGPLPGQKVWVDYHWNLQDMALEAQWNGLQLLSNITKGMHYMNEIKDSVVGSFWWATKVGGLSVRRTHVMRALIFLLWSCMLMPSTEMVARSSVQPLCQCIYYLPLPHGAYLPNGDTVSWANGGGWYPMYPC